MKKSLYLLVVVLFTFVGCKKLKINGELNPLERYFFLSATYSNKTGQGPEILIDQSNTSSIININENNAITDTLSDRNRVRLSFNNIIFKDKLGLYYVDEIVTEENNDGKWEGNSENFLRYNSVSDMTVSLVLDMSSSLGNNRTNVQSEAIHFVQTIKEKIPTANFNIIGFAQDVKSYIGLYQTNDIINKINGLPDAILNQDATALYEAMELGYDKLNVSTSNTKVLVTFTDGKNNFNGNISQLTTKIKSGNISSSHIIGLRGKDGLDEILKDLTNNGFYLETENTDDLSFIFNKIANSVVSIYSLTYDRNKGKVETPIKLRFRIKTHLI